jgi:simple sugar transport system permease protein
MMRSRTIHLSKISLLLGAFSIVALLIYALYGTRFYNLRNLTSMGFQVGEFAFLCMAMAIAMLTGGIDLSVVSNMNLAGILAAYVLTNEALLAGTSTLNIILLAVVVALLSGTIGGVINGLIIAKIGVHSVLATIGTMMLFAGFGMILTGGRGVVGFPQEFSFVGNGTMFGFPFPFLVMLAAFAVVGFLLMRSRWGKNLYLFGSNPIASLFSGINNARTIIITYALGGFLTGVSALIMISRTNSARVGYGESYLLQAIVVSVMGTMDPRGGSGRFSGVLISVILLQILSSAFTRLGITPFARGLVYGTILLLIIVAYETLVGRSITLGKSSTTVSDR